MKAVQCEALKGSNSSGMYGGKMRRPLHACLCEMLEKLAWLSLAFELPHKTDLSGHFAVHAAKCPDKLKGAIQTSC